LFASYAQGLLVQVEQQVNSTQFAPLFARFKSMVESTNQSSHAVGGSPLEQGFGLSSLQVVFEETSFSEVSWSAYQAVKEFDLQGV